MKELSLLNQSVEHRRTVYVEECIKDIPLIGWRIPEKGFPGFSPLLEESWSPFDVQFFGSSNKKRVEEGKTIYEIVEDLGAGTGSNEDALPPAESSPVECGRPEPPGRGKRERWRGDFPNGLWVAQADSESAEEKKGMSVDLGFGNYEFGLLRKCLSFFGPFFKGETGSGDIFSSNPRKGRKQNDFYVLHHLTNADSSKHVNTERENRSRNSKWCGPVDISVPGFQRESWPSVVECRNYATTGDHLRANDYFHAVHFGYSREPVKMLLSYYNIITGVHRFRSKPQPGWRYLPERRPWLSNPPRYFWKWFPSRLPDRVQESAFSVTEEPVNYYWEEPLIISEVATGIDSFNDLVFHSKDEDLASVYGEYYRPGGYKDSFYRKVTRYTYRWFWSYAFRVLEEHLQVDDLEVALSGGLEEPICPGDFIFTWIHLIWRDNVAVEVTTGNCKDGKLVDPARNPLMSDCTGNEIVPIGVGSSAVRATLARPLSPCAPPCPSSWVAGAEREPLEHSARSPEGLSSSLVMRWRLFLVCFADSVPDNFLDFLLMVCLRTRYLSWRSFRYVAGSLIGNLLLLLRAGVKRSAHIQLERDECYPLVLCANRPVDPCGQIVFAISKAVLLRYFFGVRRVKFRYTVLQDESVGCGAVVFLGKDRLRLDLSVRGYLAAYRETR